jgi:hypothetical protein
MCLTTNIIENSCANSSAGITQFWILPCDSLKAGDPFTIDADTRVISEIKYNPAVTAPKWARIKPQTDTAFANNAFTRNGNSFNDAQVISFVVGSVNCEAIKNIQDLINCCCQIAIVEDANSNYYVYGIGYNSTNGKFNVKGLKTGEGSWNSGADSAADKNEIIMTLTANVGSLPVCLDPALIAALPTF